jgi:hypothetical protein
VGALEFLALLSAVAFVAVGAAVGVKLLLLARRTKGLPERIIGASLFMLSGVAWPLLLVATGKGVSEPVMRAALAVASLVMGGSWAGMFLFTWKVFRPSEGWARALALGGICIELAAAGAGAFRALALGDASALREPSPSGLVMLLGAETLYVWTAVESFRYRALLWRRIPLGLADPLVADRFGKWGWTGVFGLGSITPTVVAQLTGGDANTPAHHLIVGVCGLASSVVLYFAFLPPAAYVRFIRQNAPSPAPGEGAF